MRSIGSLLFLIVLFILMYMMCGQRVKASEADLAMKARVAQALSQASVSSKETQKGCSCGPDCKCTRGECGDPSCPSLKDSKTKNKCCCGSSCGCCGSSCACSKDKETEKGLCPCGPSCKCTEGECGSVNCPSLKKSPGPVEWALYMVQYNKALVDNKPLLVWVGETCPSCERQWTSYIHARLSEYDGTDGVTDTGPEVIIAKPDGLGGMTIAGKLKGIPVLNQVQEILSPKPAFQQQSYCTPTVYSPPPMFMMPMPMMGGFGGFGGGGMMMGGGGCGGGG